MVYMYGWIHDTILSFMSLCNRCLSLKCFKSQNLSVKQSLQTPPLGVPGTIDIIFHFMVAVIFFIFQLPHVFTKFNAVNIFFVAKISCMVSETILSGLLGADTTALYTMFAVKHLLSSGHLALFLQLHPWLLEFG